MRSFSRVLLHSRLKLASRTTLSMVAFYFQASVTSRWRLQLVPPILFLRQSLSYDRAFCRDSQADMASGALCAARNVAPRLRLRAEESTQPRAQDNLRQILSGLLLVKRWSILQRSVFNHPARIAYLRPSPVLAPASVLVWQDSISLEPYDSSV